MNRHMVEEAGSRFFELASSLGRIHADTLSGLADATAKTPFGPVFAVNASLARMANDGIETLATRVSANAVAAAPAPAPEALKPAPIVAKAPVPKTPAPKKAKAPVAKAAAPKIADAPKPKKAKKPAPFAVEAAPVSALSDFDEPDVGDVLIDDAMVEDVLAEVEREPVALADKDDLTAINGIGATTAKKLNGIGIESFAQIAALSETEFSDMLSSLDIRTIRFSPAVWIAEAKTRMAKRA